MLNSRHRLAIGSLGSIGFRVASEVLAASESVELIAVSARDTDRALERLNSIGSTARVVPLEDLCAEVDIVVECAPAKIFANIAYPAIEAGCVFIPATVSGLLEYPDLQSLAVKCGARIIIPTGAIAGLDAVRAMSRSGIDSARLKTLKAPLSLVGAPYFEGQNFDPHSIQKPVCVFTGNTLEAARAFPANVNVAAALAMAGAGPERTTIEIWADPSTTTSTHSIEVHSRAARLELTIDVLPSIENPKSSELTPLSIMAALESLDATLRVGS